MKPHPNFNTSIHKLIYIIFFALLLATKAMAVICPGPAQEADIISADDFEYVINNCDLAGGGIFNLVNDIDLTGKKLRRVDTFSGALYGRTPSSKPHVISNFSSDHALFGTLSNASILNIKFVNANLNVVDAQAPTFGVLAEAMVGHNEIVNVDVRGNITYNSDASVDIGGLVGEVVSTISIQIIQSSFTGNISAKSTADMVIIGGLIGGNDTIDGNLIITDSYAAGTIAGGNYAGGLIGDGQPSTTINNSYSTMKLPASPGSGGLSFGFTGTCTNSYWDINTSGTSTSEACANTG